MKCIVWNSYEDDLGCIPGSAAWARIFSSFWLMFSFMPKCFFAKFLQPVGFKKWSWSDPWFVYTLSITFWFKVLQFKYKLASYQLVHGNTRAMGWAHQNKKAKSICPSLGMVVPMVKLCQTWMIITTVTVTCKERKHISRVPIDCKFTLAMLILFC